MSEEVKKIEGAVKKDWPALISGAGGIATLIGLCATLGGGVTWLINHHRHAEEQRAQMALAQTQSGQRDYQASIQTYGGILKDDPAYTPALDGQLSAAEAWVESFHVSVPEGQDPAPIAAAMLDQIMPILEAGLARANGAHASAQAAEIEAHLAWAHWWNESVAQRESGDAGADDLRKALALDPTNALANAMTGDLTLRTSGDLDEAMRSFRTAEAAGKDRPMVRMIEVISLLEFEKKGARAELVRVANAMRKNGEPLGDHSKRDIVNLCYDTTLNSQEELMESFMAVPPGEGWPTFEWLNVNGDEDDRRMLGRFVEASLLEVGGDRAGALAQFLAMQKDLAGKPGSLKDKVDAAVRRLQG